METQSSKNHFLLNGSINDRNSKHNISNDETSPANFYVEDYSLWIKVAFVFCGVFSLLTSTVAIIVMARTKKTPYAARFLSRGLLVFDVLYIMTCSVRKFVMMPSYNLNLNATAQVFLQLSYVTIGMMALERLVVFNWPIAYMKYCSVTVVRNIATTVWFTETFLFLGVRYAGCYLQHSYIMLVQAGLCTRIVSIYYSFILALVLLIAIFCYYKIFQIVRNKTQCGNQKMSLVSTAKEIKGYKSTFIVLIYFAVIMFTTVGYVFIIIMRYRGNLNVTQLRLSIELVTIVNCFLDPYLYVLWFKESQMECLKLVCSWNRTVQHKVETMRREIYDIVTSEVNKLSSKVSPIMHEVQSAETLIDV